MRPLRIGDIYERDFACGDPFCPHWKLKPWRRRAVGFLLALIDTK